MKNLFKPFIILLFFLTIIYSYVFPADAVSDGSYIVFFMDVRTGGLSSDYFLAGTPYADFTYEKVKANEKQKPLDDFGIVFNKADGVPYPFTACYYNLNQETPDITFEVNLSGKFPNFSLIKKFDPQAIYNELNIDFTRPESTDFDCALKPGTLFDVQK